MESRKYLSREILVKYLYNAVAGRFIGFLVVSHFFETRSFRNLWGFTSKKTIVSKDAFENMEWIVSVVIGFVVCEVVQKILEDKIKDKAPEYYKKGLNYLDQRGYRQKAVQLKTKGIKLASEKYSELKGKLNSRL
jgi:hypothetical protein